MRTLTEKFRAIQEGKFTKAQFLRDARLEQPNLVTQYNSYDDAVSILKNRGLLFEAEATPIYHPPVVQVEDMFSIDTVERGIDVELEKMGVETPMLPDEEQYEKAKGATLKNLLKNPNFYIDSLADVKATGKRTDLMVPATKGTTKDKDNAMVKVQIKEAVKKLIYKVLETKPAVIKEEAFGPGFNAQLAFNLHKAITNKLRATGATFEQEWPIASAFGHFVNSVAKGGTNENKETEAINKLIDYHERTGLLPNGMSQEEYNNLTKRHKSSYHGRADRDVPFKGMTENETNGRSENKVDLAKQALEDLLDPETLANPELMDQFLQNLRDEFMTTPDLFDDEEGLAEMKTKAPRRRITSEGNIR